MGNVSFANMDLSDIYNMASEVSGTPAMSSGRLQWKGTTSLGLRRLAFAFNNPKPGVKYILSRDIIVTLTSAEKFGIGFLMNSDTGLLWLGAYVYRDVATNKWYPGYEASTGTITALGSSTVNSAGTDKVLVQLEISYGKRVGATDYVEVKYGLTITVNGTKISEVFTAASICPANIIYCVPCLIAQTDSDNGNYITLSHIFVSTDPLIEGI